MTITSPECSRASEADDEPLAGTAPTGPGSWLLIEHPGPWPARDAWRALPPAAAEVCARARALGISVGLIRRAHHRRTPPPRQVILASLRGERPWLESTELADLTGITGIDLAALAAGQQPRFGPPGPPRLLLACTHGRRDRCCARLGRPAAAALADHFGDLVWESTHLGGHRFAANLLCLPDGTVHGRLTPDTAVPVARACLAGKVVLPHYRGRAGSPAPVQAAEHTVRVHLAEHRVDAVRPPAGSTGSTGTVRLTVGADEYELAVRATPDEPRWTSCDDAGPTPTPRYEARLVASYLRSG
ncbi:MAG: sucrase ferredoxin [Actinobacteria bacterium]|nr:sucrase ferredoxin [Actinomycetota bacterium]